MLDAIKPLLSLASQIYQQVQLSKANQAQCQRLGQRIEVVMTALRGLEAVSNNDNFEPGLKQLQRTLYDCLQFIEEYSKNSWFKRVIRAGTNSSKFAALTEEIRRSSELLQLGMIAHQIVNPRQDKIDNRADQKALLEKQDEILQLARAEYEQVIAARRDIQGGREEARHNRLEEIEEHHVQLKKIAEVQEGQEAALANQDKLLQLAKAGKRQAGAARQEIQAGREEVRHNRLEEIEEHHIMNLRLASIQCNLHRLLATKKKVKPLIRADLRVHFYELSIDALLTTGTMGKVYGARWLEQPVAVKMIELRLTKSDRKEFAREVDVMSRLHSPYITQLYGACIEADRACLVMEYMTRGSLHQAIPHFYTTPDEKHQMILHLARGLYYLHQRGVLHLDFNSKNVLLNTANQVKITDFGFSKIRSQSIESLGGDRRSELAWMAPERFDRDAPMTEACDIYSLGVVIWELMTGRRPFEGLADATIITQACNGERDEIPETIPGFYADLIRQCWMPIPGDRPTLIDIIHRLEAYQPDISMDQQRLPSPTPEAYYRQGLEFEKVKRYPEAAHAYQRAVQKGNHTKANTNLASFFHHGTGDIERNKAEAYERYHQSAERGHARAQFNVAKMLEKGDGISQDLDQAIHWYKEAEKNGNTKATESLNRLTVSMQATSIAQ